MLWTVAHREVRVALTEGRAGVELTPWKRTVCRGQSVRAAGAASEKQQEGGAWPGGQGWAPWGHGL